MLRKKTGSSVKEDGSEWPSTVLWRSILALFRIFMFSVSAPQQRIRIDSTTKLSLEAIFFLPYVFRKAHLLVIEKAVVSLAMLKQEKKRWWKPIAMSPVTSILYVTYCSSTHEVSEPFKDLSIPSIYLLPARFESLTAKQERWAVGICHAFRTADELSTPKNRKRPVCANKFHEREMEAKWRNMEIGFQFSDFRTE